MTLHVFNPDHDLALAANIKPFTAPWAGRVLRTDLGFLPACWAREGDVVVVDDAMVAQEGFSRLGLPKMDVSFLSWDDLRASSILPDTIEVWGWNRALRHQLLKGAPWLQSLLPTDACLAFIRNAAHRRFAATQLLPRLVYLDDRLVGCAEYATDGASLRARALLPCVLKAPWSSSGRGVRYVKSWGEASLDNWVRNVIARQGGVMVEPLYDKVMDFGMEFFAHLNGKVAFLGLSLFETNSGGAYLGSILASEDAKRQMLESYVDANLLTLVESHICQLAGEAFAGKYEGPFGIDMMVVRDANHGGFLLHPCVELNLRRTMGHVALALSRLTRQQSSPALMRILFDGHYRLLLSPSAYGSHAGCT